MAIPESFPPPDRVLTSGTHEGFDWTVLNNGRGYRCGYAKVPKGHPWFGVGKFEIEADAHGGLTFGYLTQDGEGYWVGFDCMHHLDLPDPALRLHGRPLSTQLGQPDPRAEIRSTEYVEAECRRLCEQAKAAGITA